MCYNYLCIEGEELKITPQKAFSILGLPTHSLSSEIKRAFRIQALRHHPDRGGDEGEFIKVAEAYKIALAYCYNACLDCSGRGYNIVDRGGIKINIVCKTCKGFSR